MNFYTHLPAFEMDPILGLNTIYQKDPRKNKINLGAGVYKSEQSKTVLFQSVYEAEQHLLQEKKSKDYAPIAGDLTFREEIIKFIFNTTHSTTHYAAQTVGGTAALRIAGEVMSTMGIHTIYIPDLTWPNHHPVFSRAGLEVKTYPYYDFETHKIKMSNILETLDKAPPNCAVLFQVCCHNPTGRDPTKEEWKTIAGAIKEKNIFPILDCAYQGFGQSFESDAFPIKLYEELFDQFFIGYSFAKNFGLYGERVGALLAVDKTAQMLDTLANNIRNRIRPNYSTPPIYGARIVKTILQSSSLKKMWLQEISTMQQRIIDLREKFVCAFQSYGSQKYDYIIQDRGLFSMMSLNKEQILKLRNDYGIYIIENSRLNIAGLNSNHINVVAKAIQEITS